LSIIVLTFDLVLMSCVYISYRELIHSKTGLFEDYN